MNKKNYRTLDGLYKALLPIVKNLEGGYQIVKNKEDIAIFCNSYKLASVEGYAIIRFLQVLKRADWMVRMNTFEARIELLVWINDDII